MAHAVVSDLSTKITKGLTSLLIKEVELVIGVEKELENLKERLNKINGILVDAEQKGAMKREVNEWLAKVKDVAYDAEDVFDEFAAEALRRKVEQAVLDESATQVSRQGVPELPKNIGDQVLSCFTFYWEMMLQRCSSDSNRLVFRSDMAHRIKNIIERLDHIQKDDVYFTFRSIPDQIDRKVEINVESHKRHTDPSMIATRVFGREEDQKNLVKLFTTSSSSSSSHGDINNVMVIPIIGIGGLGKTTLAHCVYDDDKVKEHFDLRMWVRVSFNFDAVLLAKEILKSMKCDDREAANVGKKLSGKRFLLVLDDVWDHENWREWDKLKNLLICGGVGSGSVIMVTTRSDIVASKMQPREPLRYTLKMLNENVCQSLFNECAFGYGTIEPNHSCQKLVEIGKDIVKKCGGVPLAAKALGRLLSHTRYEPDWFNVLNTEIWSLEGENEILPALRISYNQLPSHLKQCFAYCSLFPQDHRINVNDLIHQWMAHGFISCRRKQTLEDIGHRYFRELLWRSFFQEADEDEYGNIVRCKMHDLVHNLARSVAAKEWREVADSSSSLSSTPEGVRHMVVVFHGNKEGGDYALIPVVNPLIQPTDDDKAKKLRTLYLQCDSLNMGLQLSDGSVSGFRGLRVLNLSNLRMELVPSSIGDLQQLRYLDLSMNFFEALPNSICRLFNLQTLSLKRCRELNKWPRDITKMVSLRHLELKHMAYLEYMPQGLGQLTSLHTLGSFIVGKPDDPTILENGVGGLGELHGLNQLRGELRIEGLQNVGDARDAEKANLGAKSELQSLSLDWDSSEKRSVIDEQLVLMENLQPHQKLEGLKIGGYRGAKMPSWIIRSSSLPYLVNLELKGCYNVNFLPLIGEFPSLKFLKLDCLTGLKSICNKVAVRLRSNNNSRGGRGGEVKPLVPFPLLEELQLSRLSNFERWTMSVVDGDGEGEEDEEEGDNHLHLLSSMFPCLTILNIHACSKLTTLPILSVGGRQHLLPLRYLDIVYLDTLVSLPDFPAPATLEVLRIIGCRSLERLPDCFFHNLKVLSRFEISVCSNALTTLPQGIRHLTALKLLEIRSCPGLITLPQGLGNLSSLQELKIGDCSNLSSLPEGIRHLTALKLLQIEGCPSLIALPQGLGNLSSLEVLWITDCPNLSSLPEGIRALLKIKRCPGLIALPMNSPEVSLNEDDDDSSEVSLSEDDD